MPKKRPATNLAPVTTPLGRFVRDERDARGWGQDELAARANLANADVSLTFTNISNIERGRTALPDPPAMIGIAAAFGMPVAALYAAAGYREFLNGMPEEIHRQLQAYWAEVERKQRDEAAG